MSAGRRPAGIPDGRRGMTDYMPVGRRLKEPLNGCLDASALQIAVEGGVGDVRHHRRPAAGAAGMKPERPRGSFVCADRAVRPRQEQSAQGPGRAGAAAGGPGPRRWAGA